MGLDILLKGIGKLDDRLNSTLRDIKPHVEKWLIPGAAGLALSVESTQMGMFIGDTTYSILEWGASLTGIFGIAVPTGINLYRLYDQSKGSYVVKGKGALRKVHQKIVDARRFLTENKFVNNKYLLPLVAGAGTLHLGYTVIDDFDLVKLGVGGLISGLGVKVGRDLSRYFNRKKAKIPARNRMASKVPLLYALFSVSAAHAALERPGLTTPDISGLVERIKIPELPRMEIKRKEEIRRGREGYVFEQGQLTYWDAFAYHAERFNQRNNFEVDPDFGRAIAIVESGDFKHFDGKKRKVKKSGEDAYGLTQQTRINVDELNRLIRSGVLSGEEFSWDKVKNDPSENIRAAVYSIALYSRYSPSSGEDSLVEILANYNAGPKKVKEAKLKAGSNDIWDVLHHLTYQTNDYVRRVMAYYLTLKQGVGWPTVNTEINSYFGVRWGRHHNGIDIAPATAGVQGDPIYSVMDGVVVDTGSDNINGYYVKVRHGKPELGFETFYLHGVPNTFNVSPLDQVGLGQDLMQMGRTGRVKGKSGVHLHFGFKLDFKIERKNYSAYIDPTTMYKFYGGYLGDEKVDVSQEISLTPKNLLDVGSSSEISYEKLN